jgi:hypothetical protein
MQAGKALEAANTQLLQEITEQRSAHHALATSRPATRGAG